MAGQKALQTPTQPQMSAKPTSKTTYPPSKEIWWICTIYGGRVIHVYARLWIDARKDAARQAGCSVDSVLCVRDTEEDAKERVEDFPSRRMGPSERLKAWQSAQSAR